MTTEQKNCLLKAKIVVALQVKLNGTRLRRYSSSLNLSCTRLLTGVKASPTEKRAGRPRLLEVRVLLLKVSGLT